MHTFSNNYNKTATKLKRFVTGFLNCHELLHFMAVLGITASKRMHFATV